MNWNNDFLERYSKQTTFCSAPVHPVAASFSPTPLLGFGTTFFPPAVELAPSVDLPDDASAGQLELPLDYRELPLQHRSDLPTHERCISAESLRLLDAGIEDIKQGRTVVLDVADLEVDDDDEQ